MCPAALAFFRFYEYVVGKFLVNCGKLGKIDGAKERYAQAEAAKRRQEDGPRTLHWRTVIIFYNSIFACM